MTCYFGVGPICNDYRGATLQGPKGSLHLQEDRDKNSCCDVGYHHIRLVTIIYQGVGSV